MKDFNMLSPKRLATAAKEFTEEKIFELTITEHSIHYIMLQGIIENARYDVSQ